MTIQHTFNYVTAEGKEFISLIDWVKTLPDEEQAEYAVALAANIALDDQHRANGDLISAEGDKRVYAESVVTKFAQGQFSYTTPEWKVWFDRYQLETGITLDIAKETI